MLDPAAGLTQVLSDGTNTYLYGNGRLAQYQAEMQYFGADGLGSVRQLYDASGMVAANNRHDPYGNVLSQYGTATSVFAFAGEQYDAGTGLEYLRARYYSSAQGRFTTRDVWEGICREPLSLNAWNYAEGDPVNSIDPSGKCTGGVGLADFMDAAIQNQFGPSWDRWAAQKKGLGALQQMADTCAENLSKARVRFEQGNYLSSAAYGTGFLTAAEQGQAWIYGWNSNMDAIAASRFTRMYLQDPYLWWTRLRP